MRLTRNKCANDETPINHGVGEEDEPAVAGALLELAACLGAANTASRIFAYIMSSVISMYYYMLFGTTKVIQRHIPPIPIPTKKRQAVSMLNMPTASP